MSDWNKIRIKASEFWLVTRKRLAQTGSLLKNESIVARKSFDLVAIKRRLRRAYANLGKAVYDAHVRESEDLSIIMARRDMKGLLFTIETLRIEVEIKEKEIEAYKARAAA